MKKLHTQSISQLIPSCLQWLGKMFLGLSQGWGVPPRSCHHQLISRA